MSEEKNSVTVCTRAREHLDFGNRSDIVDKILGKHYIDTRISLVPLNDGYFIKSHH